MFSYMAVAPRCSRSHPACGAVGGWSVFGLVICGHRWSCWCPPWSSGSHRCHFRCPVPSSGVYNQCKGHGQVLPISTVSSLTVWTLFKDPRAQTHRIRIASSPRGSLRLFPDSFPFGFFFVPFLSLSLPDRLLFSSERRDQALLPLLLSVTVHLWRTRSPPSRLCLLLFNHRNTTVMITAAATPSPVATPTTGHIQAGENPWTETWHLASK